MSDRSRDDETQRFNDEYTDDDFLNAVRECPVASTTEIAERLGCNQSTAYRRLTKLEDDDEVMSESLSANARVWYVADE
ncbi:winged helix-turn-helix domain-containing protein [Natrinema versiforme]|uniref:Hth domain-containing protein n=1 Tax=Natrinema versiforme JCM 10478 TaxID=1227496 RepID=L9Y5C5_9EURY|nr:winged helix-turn-helix transcriptional regulator [Natrinema versiforme]ELY68861.1 hth domain-containing protein [Natrinema versiforme JCM 10478]